MRRGRLLIAGLTATAAMMAANASAQNCPEYLALNCPNESLTVPADESAAQGQGEQATRGKPGASGATRTKQTRPTTPAATDAAANPKPQQAQATTSGPARPARTARPALNPQEKEALFQQFLTWRQERRQAPETNR
jgi:hypothetical protein